jgi:hypothetical protein
METRPFDKRQQQNANREKEDWKKKMPQNNRERRKEEG